MNAKNNPSRGRSTKSRTTSKDNSIKKSTKPANSKKSIVTKKDSPIASKWTKKKVGDPLPKMDDNEIRLNKYLSNAGICSRREADVLIQTGVVTVNGKIVTEMGYKVKPTDQIQYDGETINSEKKQYVLLNKPKDFITSSNDPWGRKTVMSLIVKACKERVYPIGRLDRDSTGLMLFTNDSDLTKKLLHPTRIASSLYHLESANPIQQEDINRLLKGIEFDDSFIKIVNAEFVPGKANREIGIEINSEKSHALRRIFDRMGYKVVKLDRVMFAGLTKKDLPRGHYRMLTEKEIAFLRMN